MYSGKESAACGWMNERAFLTNMRQTPVQNEAVAGDLFQGHSSIPGAPGCSIRAGIRNMKTRCLPVISCLYSPQDTWLEDFYFSIDMEPYGMSIYGFVRY